MRKHLFYSLLITFCLFAVVEILQPGFAVLFLNMDGLFLAVIFSGILSLVSDKRKLTPALIFNKIREVCLKALRLKN